MKIKLLPILSSLILATIFTSCLKSDNKTIELSTDATVHAISIDTVFGKEVPLTIDQINNQIFNTDSLPVNADTIVNNILVKSIQTVGGMISRIGNDGKDTIFNYQVDSVDLSKPLKFKVYAMDHNYDREYTLTINVHKEDPDSLLWVNMNNSPQLNKGESFAVSLDDNIFIYDNKLQASTAKTPKAEQWNEIALSRLDEIQEIQNVLSSKNKLYMLADNTIFVSENGETWTNMQLGTNIQNLLVVTPDNTLMAIREGKFISKKEKDESWKEGSLVPTDFPTQRVSSAFYERNNSAILMGQPEEGESTLAWFSETGSTWSKMISTNVDKQCPYLEQPHVFYYDKKLYAFGAKYDAIYESLNGQDWNKVNKKVFLPKEFEDKKEEMCALTIDQNNYIWIYWNSNEVWRGRINKFGHIIQK
ncbi:hypothetical protein Bcop_0599 [Bacteroides coprosuis DSM 18011]|uniref:Lipoprotein n=1 Tax=Bacteroides coprosuis DSM 18011 TaxID=679937 RepID=F3ZS11_9BACE|nr:DUF6242 domain-containing protein [Bacteroides coprosuis]EGJ70817.1 hypothetical protein Bcop_0599 [Bacteroides coprosuis DSM 18011]